MFLYLLTESQYRASEFRFPATADDTRMP